MKTKGTKERWTKEIGSGANVFYDNQYLDKFSYEAIICALVTRGWNASFCGLKRVDKKRYIL